MDPTTVDHRASWRRPAKLPQLPLADEAHVADWRRYAEEAEVRGALPTLRDKLVQLQLPIAVGISETPSYLRATRGGVPPVLTFETAAAFHRPDEIEILLHNSVAGALPVIRADDRRDFVTLVRALTGRNEPIAVPPSMGACLVQGLVNWDRIHRYRSDWEEGTDGATEPGAWQAQLVRLRQRKELYQDRFLILSRGEYSGVEAADVGLGPSEWSRRSGELRLAHESTHYLVLRVFNRFPNRVLDELIADMVGLIAAFDRYSGPLALSFFGLEGYPRYRPGGRLENYSRHPMDSRAFADLTRSVHDAILGIESLAAGLGRADERELAELVIRLTASSLEYLAGHCAENRSGES